VGHDDAKSSISAGGRPPSLTNTLTKSFKEVHSAATFHAGSPNMSLLIAQWMAAILLLISLIHLYWAAGGKLGSEAAVPRISTEGGGGIQAGLQAFRLCHVARGGRVAVDCDAGVLASRPVSADGASLVAASG